MDKASVIDEGNPYLLAKDGMITLINDAFIDFSGYYPDDVILKPLAEVFKMLFKSGADKYDMDNLEEHIEIYMFTKGNQVREVEVKVLKFPHSREKMFVFLEKAGSGLEDKFGLFEQLFLENVEGIAVYSVPDLYLLQANQKYLDFLEEPYNKLENSVGHPINKIAAGWVGSRFDTIWEAVLETKKVQYLKEEKYIGFSRGITYWDSIIFPVYEKGELRYILNIGTDVTERVLTRQRMDEQTQIIRQEKAKFETIIENVSDTIGIVDRNGCYLSLYKAKIDIEKSGTIQKAGDSYEKNKYFDRNGNEIEKENLPICRVGRGEKITQERVSIKRPDEIRHFEFSGAPVFDDKGDLLMGIVCGWDVTEKVKYEELKKKQEEYLLKKEMDERKALENAMQLKDEFLSMISHEFKTPLTVINSAIQAMEAMCGNEMSERSKKFLRSIKQNSFRQWRLVNNLLDITRANAGRINIHKSNIDIVFLTKEIVDSIRLYAQQKEVTMSFSAKPERKIIGMDDEKYERILLNLLSNAIKYTPRGGWIAVKVSSGEGSIRVDVKDSGSGIPKNRQDLIFERFGQVDSSLTRQAEGTGIGLYLVKMFVDALGGTISLKSREGKGSTFSIYLPDEKVEEAAVDKKFKEYYDNRLIQTIAIEFSDIYL